MSLADSSGVRVGSSGLVDNVEVLCTHIRQGASSTTASCSLDILLVNRSSCVRIRIHLSILLLASFMFLLNISLFHVCISTLGVIIIRALVRSWHLFEYVVLDKSFVLLYLTNKVTGIVG